MNLSLRCKIIGFLLLVFLTLGVYAVYYYTLLVEHDTWHVRTLNREITADGARMFDGIIEQTFTLLRGLARQPAVLARDARASSNLLSGLLASERHVQNILAIDAQGRVFGSALKPGAARAIDQRNSPWFREAMRGEMVGHYHLSRLTGKPVLMVALPVRGRDGKSAAGVVAAELDLASISRALTRSLLLQENAFLYVIGPDGVVVIDTDGVKGGKTTDLAVASVDGTIVDRSAGEKQLYTMMPTMYGDLRVVVGIPVEEAYEDARVFGKRFLVVFLLLSGTAVTAGLVFASRTGRRIGEINCGLREMEKGNLEARIPVHGHDELRYVAERFNAMADARGLAEAALKEAVETVTEEQARTKAILEAISDGISIQDKQFRVLYQNEAHRRLAGDHAGEFCYRAYAKSDRVCDGCPVRRSFHDGKVHVLEKNAPAKNGGKTFIEIAASPLRDASGKIVASIEVLRDITELKENERSLALSGRFAALGRMASGIAHEINNPLAAMNGCAEGLLGRIGRNAYDPELFRRYLSIIQEEIFRCKSITTSMLSFVRRDSDEKSVLDLRAVAHKALELVGFEGRLKNVEVAVNFPPDVPAIHGNEGELRQVLLTLITNAIDAMEERGALTLSMRRSNGSVEVSVADTGPGIPLENRERIFEPFFTTKPGRTGTGLGLSIANRIVANHQGVIFVGPENGKTGAVFTVRLPISRHAQKEEPV